MAADDDMALGVEQALDEAGAPQTVWILGGGGMKEMVKKVKDRHPRCPATITYPPSMIAAGMHLCVSNLRDGKPERIAEFLPRHIKLDVTLVTPENAAQFHFPDSVY